VCLAFADALRRYGVPDEVLSGPFTVTVSKLPFGPGIRPYPTSYAEITGGGASTRFQVSCRRFGHRHSLLGSSCARWGLHLPHNRPTGGQPTVKPPDPNGVVVLHMSKTRPGRAPP
jgi:hypothetical protein